MSTEEAKNNVGKMVMSKDAGHKLIYSVNKFHGPYLLKKITKGGLGVIARWENEDLQVPTSLLKPVNHGTERAL